MVPDYARFVKEALGDITYNKRFKDGTTDPRRTKHEFLHYNVILYDQQMLYAPAYRANKGAHIYSLLRSIALDKESGDKIVLYVLIRDFQCTTLNALPVKRRGASL